MRIGIDFDNTIACYDGVFHAAALERGLIPSDLGRRKKTVTALPSHKTRHPLLGPKYDTHAAARGFLSAHGLMGEGALQIDPSRVFFELTKEEKIARAAVIGCEIFIDDLPEIITMPGFPDGMRRILFDPTNQFAGVAESMGNLDRRLSWALIAADLNRERV